MIRPLAERFDALCGDPDENGCIPWLGAKGSSGYGIFTNMGHLLGAHRVIWEITHAEEIPAGLQIDHLCMNRACVNPEHLEAVTGRENMRRRASLITHCPVGHPYSAENTQLQRNGEGVKRSCRECRNERGRAKRYWVAYRARKKEAA